jgi:hypothetical protein
VHEEISELKKFQMEMDFEFKKMLCSETAKDGDA